MGAGLDSYKNSNKGEFEILVKDLHIFDHADFSFQLCSTANSKFYFFMFYFEKLIASKLRRWV